MDTKLCRSMLAALRAALVDITETASITCGRYNRQTKKYEFNDSMWKSGAGGSFKVAQRLRREIAKAELALTSHKRGSE